MDNTPKTRRFRIVDKPNYTRDINVLGLEVTTTALAMDVHFNYYVLNLFFQIFFYNYYSQKNIYVVHCAFYLSHVGYSLLSFNAVENY